MVKVEELLREERSCENLAFSLKVPQARSPSTQVKNYSFLQLHISYNTFFLLFFISKIRAWSETATVFTPV